MFPRRLDNPRRRGSQPDAIVGLNLGVSTAYAVRGQRTVLVDTGPAGSSHRLLDRLQREGVDPASISMIVLTHCHPDHAGGAADLRDTLGVPVAVHHAEADWAREGRSQPGRPVRPFGHVLTRVLKPTFPPFTPDVLLDDRYALDDHGVGLTVLHTPGHTPGSITLLHRRDGDALVGDLLAGGLLRRNRPNLPFLADDLTTVAASTQAVLATPTSRLLFGHGKPASVHSVLRRFPPGPPHASSV